ncbi:ribosomal protein S10 domain-containing protein [Umbelopsis sp. PMI_123]|nr:ribosomal protein S10 domain-containing protein [Umbelopsis sp. PMI_123]
MLKITKSLAGLPNIAKVSLTRTFVSSTRSGSAEIKNKIDLPEVHEPAEGFDDVYQVPERIQPTHGIPVCNLHFRGYLPQHLDFYVDFARRAAFALKMPCSGPVYLPTQTSRWTVIKSPFVHKKSQENFERKTHKRLLQIKDAHPEVVQRWLHYLKMNAPAGIGLRATTWEFENVGVGKTMVEKAKKLQRTTPLPAAEDNETQVKEIAAQLLKNIEAEAKNEA